MRSGQSIARPAAGFIGSALLPMALLHVLLFVASMVVIPVLAPGAKIPNRFGPESASRDFFLNHGNAIRVSAFLSAV